MRGVLLALALLIGTQAPRAAAQPSADAPPEREIGKLPQRGELLFDIDKGAWHSKRGYETVPAPPIGRAQPLYLQADDFIDDTDRNSVVVRGNVKIYYNNYILTAVEVILDRTANKLTAAGNAQLKEPSGQITRADRLEATDDFRNAFVQSFVAKIDCAANPNCTGPRKTSP